MFFLKNLKAILVYLRDHFTTEISWALVKMVYPFFIRVKEENSVLLIPAANLDGGFGEDLMVLSYISNFARNKRVTIFTEDVIVRSDYLTEEYDVEYLKGMSYNRLNYFEILNVLSKYKEVYVIGADIIDGTYGVNIALHRLRILELASLLKCNAQISGFSVSNNIVKKVGRKLNSISNRIKIKCRDIDSYNRLINYIPERNLILTNDIAFICPSSKVTENRSYGSYTAWTKMVTSKGFQIIAVCPNSIQANKLGYEQYFKDLTILLDSFLRIRQFAFVFLYHDVRAKCGTLSDKSISCELNDFFSQQPGCFCYYPSQIENGASLKEYLRLVDFTVTGRMHLGISGLTSNKPMFGIAYANKFEGMVRLFGVDPSLCLVDFDKMASSQNVVNSFLSRYSSIQSSINRNLLSVTKGTLLNYEN